jgi:hypothetical protein
VLTIDKGGNTSQLDIGASPQIMKLSPLTCSRRVPSESAAVPLGGSIPSVGDYVGGLRAESELCEICEHNLDGTFLPARASYRHSHLGTRFQSCQDRLEFGDLLRGGAVYGRDQLTGCYAGFVGWPIVLRRFHEHTERGALNRSRFSREARTIVLLFQPSGSARCPSSSSSICHSTTYGDPPAAMLALQSISG